MKKRATRYEHAKACHVTMSRDRQDAKSYVIKGRISSYISYRVTIKKRATRYKYAKAYYVIYYVIIKTLRVI